MEVAPGVPLGEVLATFRTIAALQERFGEEACRRFVVSFTAAASDATDVLRLAADRGGRGRRQPRRAWMSSRSSSRPMR